MEWIKASIKTAGDAVENITGLLMMCGITGVEIIDAQERARFFAEHTRNWDYADESLLVADSNFAYVIFYVTNDNAGTGLLNDIAEKLKAHDTSATLTKESTNDETWLNEWKKHFKPIKLGRIVVVPEWEHYQPQANEVVFTIDPGTAFGTGQHQTTQLCINALQRWVRTGDKLLDIGCGSGILSIIGLLLGASYVYAIDVDPAGAIAATKKNAKLNPVNLNLLTVAAGDVLTNESVKANVGNGYDVTVANIVADVIIPLAPLSREFTKTDGLFIASGIITARLPEVLSAFATGGLAIISQEELEGWHCIVGKYNA